MGSNEIPPVIVDTDTGLDDAVALFMVLEAHRRGLINVVAITTTHGNTSLKNVNKNVLRLLETVGMLNIPVCSGSEAPLVHPYPLQGDKPFHGFDGFGNTNLPHPDVSKYIQKKSAVLKILEEVQLNKGRLIVLALGPLTNIALAKKIEPRLLSQLASLHIMGGNTTGEGNKSPCGEFNFFWDPEAAQIVLSQDPSPATDTNRSLQISAASYQPSSVAIKGSNTTTENDNGGTDLTNCDEAQLLVSCPVYITPWETCIQAVHLPYTFRDFLGTKPTPQAALMGKGEAEVRAEREFEDWVTCDQLAAAWMLDQLLGDKLLPDTERGSYLPIASKTMDCNVTVELQGTHTRGQMVLDRLNRVEYSLPVTLLMGVNQDIYKRYLSMAFGHPF